MELVVIMSLEGWCIQSLKENIGLNVTQMWDDEITLKKNGKLGTVSFSIFKGKEVAEGLKRVKRSLFYWVCHKLQ